ncbi:MAG: MarR family transcriptional regulator [Bryobacterales bacterium]|nr:MarR family transcriptional regulator [Bryobacterales bacterium]
MNRLETMHHDLIGKPPDLLTTLEQRFTYRFAMTASWMGSALAPSHERFGLSVAMWRVLAVIGRYEPLSARELANRTSLDPFRVTRILTILCDKGFVSRRTDRTDRRKISLRLTRVGRATHDEIAKKLSEMERLVLDALSVEEQKTLFQLLDKLDASINTRLQKCRREND